MLDWLERLRLPLAFLAAAAFFAAVWLVVERAQEGARPLELIATDAPPGGVKVEVTGAVQRPGVYSFEPGARIADALAAAGGPTAEAATGALNLASRLRDEQRLIVPTRRQIEEAAARRTASAAPAASGDGAPALIDLNSANQRTLESLPGIGVARARRIIDSREAEGLFFQPEDLLERSLVPRSVFEAIRGRVVAAPP